MSAAKVRQQHPSARPELPQQVFVRPYRPDLDATAILRVFDRSFPVGHPFLDAARETALARKVVEAQLTDRFKVLLADVSGVVAGFIIVDRRGYIPGLYVDPASGHIGIGSTLLASVASSHRRLTLHVFEENASAVRFYRIRGFHVVDEDRAVDGLGRGHYRLKMAR